MINKRLPYLMLLCLLWLCILVFTTSCTGFQPAKQYVYFVAVGSEGDQIWQMSADGSSSRVVYEIYSSVQRPASDVLPGEELQWLENLLVSITPTLSSSQIYLTPHIAHLSLSPDKQKLSWIETDFGCYSGAATCVGGQRLVTLDLSTGNQRQYWKTAMHSPEGLPSQGILSQAWSPNGRYIAFAIGSTRSRPCVSVLRIADVQDNTVNELGEGGERLSWSSDGQHLIASDCDSSGTIIRRYGIGNNSSGHISVPALDFGGLSSSWSRKSNQIAVAAAPSSDLVYTRTALYTVDPFTGIVKGILSTGGSYENPQWSPDGNLLAMDSRLDLTKNYDQLIIVDPQTGETLANLREERANRVWQWSQDGSALLVLRGIREIPQSIIVWSIKDNSIKTLPLPMLIENNLSKVKATEVPSRDFSTPPRRNVIMRIDQLQW